MITILVAKDKILVTIDTCDYKPCNSFEQVAKKTILQKKLHTACIVTLIVGYHMQL
jgi:hypothetical protein